MDTPNTYSDVNADYLAQALAYDFNRPGKFEGETPATLYYYLASLDGDGDLASDGHLLIFAVSPGERTALHGPANADIFTLYEDDSGFVTGRWERE